MRMVKDKIGKDNQVKRLFSVDIRKEFEQRRDWVTPDIPLTTAHKWTNFGKQIL